MKRAPSRRRIDLRKALVRALASILVVFITSVENISAYAGLRGPGKYCGVVFFDRWDSCLLLSGPYITYISENVKEKLRPFAGMAIQVDASDVFQPMNPGDALIRKYEILGPAPDTHHWVVLDGLELTAEADFSLHALPGFLIEIRNVGSATAKLASSEIGPVLMGSGPASPFRVSDGLSEAVITRANLLNSSSREFIVDGMRRSASYVIDSKTRPPEVFELKPSETMKARITINVPPGQYQFIFGYGGGVHEEKSLASNSISFQINVNGMASLI